MLVIRMQRTGRKGHANFRVVVQDSRRTPTSGKVVAQIGTYDPHSKNVTLNKEKAQHYLDHGAQPTDRVAALFKAEGVKLPKWVKEPVKQEGKIKNPEKLRRNQPKEAPALEPAPEEASAEVAEEPAAEEPAPAADAPEASASEATEAPEAEAPAEDK